MSELDSRLAALYVLKRYRKQSSWSKDSLRIAQDNYKLKYIRQSHRMLLHFDGLLS